MNTPCFTSRLADRMLQFLSFKHMQGYDYVEGGMNLARFDAFMASRSCQAPLLRREDLDAYCTELSRIPVATQAKLLSTVRQFSRYLRAFETQSESGMAAGAQDARQAIRFESRMHADTD